MIGTGGRPSSKETAEWVLFWLRWLMYGLALAGAFVSPAPGQQIQLVYVGAAVGLGTNLLIALLLALNAFPRVGSLVSQILDVGLLLFLFWAGGQGYTSYFALSALPVIGAAVRFGALEALLTAILLLLGQVACLAFTFAGSPGPARLMSFGFNAVVLLAAALLAMAGLPVTAREAGSRRHPPAGGDARGAVPARIGLQQLRNFYRLAGTLSETLNYERVLHSLLDSSVLALQELGLVATDMPRMVLLFGDRGRLKVVAARSLREADMEREIPGQDGLVHAALASAEPMTGGPADQDPELREFRGLSACQSLLCVPLRAGLKGYGAVLLGCSQRDAFRPEHLELMTAFCNQAVIALENARLYRSVEEEKERIIASQEESRRRLARELHDGPTQSISAIAMRLNFTKLLATREPNKASAELDKLENLARRTAKEIRMMLFTLRPVVLETQGLAAACRQYAEKVLDAESLPVHVESALDERLPGRVEDVAFSIIEEAVNNARKHAKAQNVWVRLKATGDVFAAEIEDDGKGFDVGGVTQSYDQRGSLGLINMRERASLVNGRLAIESTPGAGTRIVLTVPLGGQAR